MTDVNSKTYLIMNRIKEVLEEKGIKQTWLVNRICQIIEVEEFGMDAIELVKKLK